MRLLVVAYVLPACVDLFVKSDFQTYHLEELTHSSFTMRNCRVSYSGQYTVTATNSAGSAISAVWLTVVGEPGAPSKPTARFQTENSVKLWWKPPKECGNASVLWYTVQFRTGSKDEFDVAVDSVPNSSVLIEDLIPEKTYWFRIRAFSEAAVGEPSPESSPVTIPKTREEGVNSPPCMSKISDIQIRQDFFRHFLVELELGRGRFAIVKEATCRLTGRPYAVKVSNRSNRLRVINEFGILSQLRHDSIVQALSVYETAQDFLFLMQKIPGPPILEFLCHLGYYNEAITQSVTMQLLAVLQYLDSAKIVHCDLKPENILADPSKGVLRISVIDFGDSVMSQPDKSTVHQLQGSIEFAAPEQLCRGQLSSATDMWSLGVFVYVLLSGLSPFLEDSTEETITNILNASYSFPDVEFGLVSKYAPQLIRAMLLPVPEHRISTSEAHNNKWFFLKAESGSWSVMPLTLYLERRKFEVSKRDHLFK